MGLDISTFKLKKRLGDRLTEEIEREYENWAYIYTLNFAPITHLSKFSEGVYDIEQGICEASFSYGGFDKFRERICYMVYKKDYKSILYNVEQYLKQPFIEMLYFADNEGSFDYVIAEKLYKDFKDYEQQAMLTFDEFMYGQYVDYMNCLKEVVDLKGVMYYH